MMPKCPDCSVRLEFIGLEERREYYGNDKEDYDLYDVARYYCHSCNTLFTRRVQEKDFPKEEAKPCHR